MIVGGKTRAHIKASLTIHAGTDLIRLVSTMVVSKRTSRTYGDTAPATGTSILLPNGVLEFLESVITLIHQKMCF